MFYRDEYNEMGYDYIPGEKIRFRGQANIWKVLNGERRHAGGYHFEYLKEDDYGSY